MTDINIIPTANLGVSTRASSQKVSTSDYNIERQPKITIWSPKPEIVTSLEIQQIASKFQRQVRSFRPRRAGVKCSQLIATMKDNQKWQCGPKTGNAYISGTMTDKNDNSNGKSGVFDHTQRDETDPGRLRQRPTTGNGNIDFWAPILQFLELDWSRSHLANLSSSSPSSKNPNLALEFRHYLSELRRCNYLLFWGHIDICGCQSLLLANTIFHLYVVLNLRFVVGILTVPHIVSEYKYFRFRLPFPIVDHYWNPVGTLPASLPCSNVVGSPLEFWWYVS